MKSILKFSNVSSLSLLNTANVLVLPDPGHLPLASIQSFCSGSQKSGRYTERLPTYEDAQERQVPWCTGCKYEIFFGSYSKATPDCSNQRAILNSNLDLYGFILDFVGTLVWDFTPYPKEVAVFVVFLFPDISVIPLIIFCNDLLRFFVGN